MITELRRAMSSLCCGVGLAEGETGLRFTPRGSELSSCFGTDEAAAAGLVPDTLPALFGQRLVSLFPGQASA